MEVTIENFESLVPLVSESIASSDFVAIDTEFSGKPSSPSSAKALSSLSDVVWPQGLM